MTKKILVTGGTVFVSKFVATYFKNHDYDVYVLNRGNRKQIEGVKLIKGDRHHLGNLLKGYDFDVVFDVTACLLYTSPSPRDRQKSRMPSSA